MSNDTITTPKCSKCGKPAVWERTSAFGMVQMDPHTGQKHQHTKAEINDFRIANDLKPIEHKRYPYAGARKAGKERKRLREVGRQQRKAAERAKEEAARRRVMGF